MKSNTAKYAAILVIALLGALSGYWLGHRSATSASNVKPVPLAASALKAGLINGANGKPVDWQGLLDATGAISPDLLAAWARTLDSDAINADLRAIANEPPSARRNDIMAAFYTTLADRDPKLFLSTIVSIQVPRLRELGIDEALKNWAAQDSKGALDWIKQNPGTSSVIAANARYAAAIAGFASTDPAGALDVVNQLNDDDLRDRLLKNAAAKSLADALADQGGFAQAAAFFTKLAAGQTRDDALAELAHRWTAFSPRDAADWVESLNGDPDVKARLVAQIAEDWAAFDPPSAATWAANMDTQQGVELYLDGAHPGRMLATAIHAWTDYDLDPAGIFLNQLPANRAKDSAIAMFALRSSQENPADAFQWVNTITDPETRLGMTQAVALEWMQQDLTSYNQFINSTSTLNEEQKALLAAMPPEVVQGLQQFNTVLGGGDAVQAMMENAILSGKSMMGDSIDTLAPPSPSNAIVEPNTLPPLENLPAGAGN